MSDGCSKKDNPTIDVITIAWNADADSAYQEPPEAQQTMRLETDIQRTIASQSSSDALLRQSFSESDGSRYHFQNHNQCTGHTQEEYINAFVVIDPNNPDQVFLPSQVLCYTPRGHPTIIQRCEASLLPSSLLPPSHRAYQNQHLQTATLAQQPLHYLDAVEATFKLGKRIEQSEHEYTIRGELLVDDSQRLVEPGNVGNETRSTDNENQDGQAAGMADNGSDSKPPARPMHEPHFSLPTDPTGIYSPSLQVQNQISMPTAQPALRSLRAVAEAASLTSMSSSDNYPSSFFPSEFTA
jgi:hypothetical protein